MKGRNYWDRDTNAYHGSSFGQRRRRPAALAHGTNLNDGTRALVTIFLTTTDAFATTGQFTYPITGFITIYITGYGRISGGVPPDDPCPGSAPPSDLNLGPGNASGYALVRAIVSS